MEDDLSSGYWEVIEQSETLVRAIWRVKAASAALQESTADFDPKYQRDQPDDSRTSANTPTPEDVEAACRWKRPHT